MLAQLDSNAAVPKKRISLLSIELMIYSASESQNESTKTQLYQMRPRSGARQERSTWKIFARSRALSV